MPCIYFSTISFKISFFLDTMSQIKEECKNEAVSLKEHLHEMPRNVHLFSLSMRSLYAEQAVGTSTKTAQKFRQLRDGTRQHAMVYLKFNSSHNHQVCDGP